MRTSRASFVLIGVIAFAACGSADSADPTSTTDTPATTADVAPVASPDGDWVAISGVTGGAAVELIDGWDVTMSIDGDQIGGTAACNSYGGTVDVGVDGLFAVGELSWTEMGCEAPVQNLEQIFLASLGSATNYSVDDGALTIGSVSDEWVFERLAPVDAAALVGTTWVLDTAIDGDAASNSPLMESATLTLHEDGTLSGSTSCRQLGGEWSESGAEVEFTSFAVIEDPTAGQCAPESVELENVIVAVLGDGFSATVEGHRLTFMTSGGEGLSYTALP